MKFKISPLQIKDPADESASGEHKIRLEKVEALRTVGAEPWPSLRPVNAHCHDVIAEFEPAVQSREYSISGRIMTLRGHGKTIFATLQDMSGNVQIYIKQEDLGDEKFKQFNTLIDIGDIIWVQGHSFKTKTGQVTLKVSDVALQSKCLFPLPDKFHGLHDREVRYRQRYLDLISSSESRERFKKRSLIVRAMRNYLDSFDFLEVETPMLHPIPGGAAAKPFVTHHNALSADLYLRIAPELYLKKLVIGGFERVYEINRNFRNEGVSTRHNPEFTTVEFYTAYKDYIWAMDFVENMLKKIGTQCFGTLEFPYEEYVLNFERPFARLSMEDAVLEYCGLQKVDIQGTAIDTVLKMKQVEVANKNASWGEKLYALFEKFVEPHLIQPTFITHFPVEVSPLAKRDPANPALTSRFELFMVGMELGNGFNELNDPFDQAERFHEQAKARAAGDVEAHHFDADYVHALEYGLPPTVGVGIGIDRLVMFMTNTPSIKDVLLFPTLKKKQ